MAGLFGLGGLGGIGGAQPPAGLLGPYFNPADMRKQQLKQGLLAAGIGLLTGGKGSTGEVLGQGLAAGLQGANNAGINYKQDAMGYNKLAMDMQEQERKRKQEAAVAKMVESAPPDQRALWEAYPELGAKAYLELQTASPKPPAMETLFDEQTGQQYKGQWNPQTQKWDRVGGLKPSDDGMTVYGPDGNPIVTTGAGGGKVTEGMRRAKGFKASMKSSIANLQTTFEALTDPQNYIGDALKDVGGRAIMTPEGQMAADSFDEVVADALYIASGATLTQPEIVRKVAAIRPAPNDSKETKEAKRQRLKDLVDAVDIMAGDPPGSGHPTVNQAPAVPGIGGKTSTGVPWSVQ